MDLHGVQSGLDFLSACELTDLLDRRQVSSLELVDHFASRIERLDGALNAVVTRHFDAARDAARDADRRRAAGERLPLLGLPVTIKESFSVSGMATTWGQPDRRDYKPAHESLAVSRLKAAGGIVMGKTNVPLMLGDFQSRNPLFGATNNPWDVSRTCGGSSGGGAAALAAGFIPLEMGTDFAGSLRVPAHFCGVYGHRPSQELVPMRGVVPPGMPVRIERGDFAVAGPMARTPSDLRLALDVLMGADPLIDGIGYRVALPPPRHRDLSSYRVLIPDPSLIAPVSTALRDGVDNLARRLVETGCNVVRSSELLPDFAAVIRTHMSMVGAAISEHLPDQMYEVVREAAGKVAADDESPNAWRLRGIFMTHREWLAKRALRNKLAQQWRDLVQSFDVVITPCFSTLAHAHDDSPGGLNDMFGTPRLLDVDGTKVIYKDQLAWSSIATLLGLPATTAPIGLSQEGLPIGIQIIGGYLEDQSTIEFACLMEAELCGFVPPPAYII